MSKLVNSSSPLLTSQMSKCRPSSAKAFVSGSWQPVSALVAGLMFSLVATNVQSEGSANQKNLVDPPALVNAAVIDADGTKSRIELKRVNLNLADAEQLATTISGIGPSKAAAIIAYRDEHGAFRSVEEILNVPGIGETTLARIRAFLSVGTETAESGSTAVVDG